jgi:xanthine dehydrogenase accessory factor
MRMHELLAEIRQRQAAGDSVALATLVDVLRSAPRDPGAVMAICASGQLFGSISGGCVEAALVQEATGVLRDGRARLVDYGLSDADAQAVGLSCGGTLSVLVEPLDQAETAAIERRMSSEALVAESMRLDDRGRGNRLFIFEDSTFGSLGNDRLDDVVASEVRASIAGEATEIRGYGDEGEPHGDVRVFIHCVLAKPRMYIFGAIDFAHAMVRVAKLLGYEVTLCDARPAFATTERFPEADRVVVAWPDDFLRDAPVDERTAIVALTHDEKFDIPLIRAALETNAGYIGVMGSRRTNERRLAQLRELGTSEAEIARLNAPIGLDLGARTPEETAIAIASEIIALRHGREGGRLVRGTGPVRGQWKSPQLS